MSNIRPVVQGAHSSTFTTPPVDGSLAFPELLAFHATHSGSHSLFVYAEDGENKSIDYAATFRAQLVAAAYVKSTFDAGSHFYVDKIERPVFGILANADAITYATVIFGIQQAGAVPFPISTRNSAIAVAHLLRATGVRQVFVSEDTIMRGLAAEAAALLAKDQYVVELLDLPRFEVLYERSTPAELSESNDYRIAPISSDALAVILHSSGTSAFPKPIKMTSRNFVAWGSTLYHGDVDVCGIRLGIQSSPMFHAMSSIALAWAVCCGLELAVFKPARPPVVAHATAFLNDLVLSKSEWTMSVPAHIEEWSQDPESVGILKSSLKRVIFGGGPLNKQVGDALFAEGVFLDNLYGLTEAGPIIRMAIAYDSRPADWEYFRFLSADLATFAMIPHEEHGGLVEPVLLAGDYYSPNVFNTTVDGRPGYATGDLVQEHPVHKGLYRIHGRADEQIMHSNGEKTNPVPLERILLQDPNIQIAIFFGRGRFNTGALIQPSMPFDPNNVEKLNEFRDSIWPSVIRMNEYAPAHSRLFKNMILVATPAKPLELTAKGSARRNAAETSQDGPHPPSSWTPESTLEFVQAVVEMAMEQTVPEGADLFALGCDSLAATTIRNNVVRALRTSTTASTTGLDVARKAPQTLVYQNPSIRALSDFIYALVTGRDLEPDTETIRQQKAQAMEAMVAKYSNDFVPLQVPAGAGPLPERETVLVTGTTGRLGCHLLYQLLQDPKVGHIYALNRATGRGSSPEALLGRMRGAFESWELDSGLLESGKITLLASDYAADRLGLDADTYAEIQGQLTTIIHNAWRVDFNVVLSSFEPLIMGVRNLINLASHAPTPGGARFLFVGSVSVLFGAPENQIALEEPILDARLSAGIGYGESKWVAETLLLRARDAVGLRASTVRVGQIAGDTRVGGWNKQEWVGAIARLGQMVHAIPERDEPISWVPVDVVATTLIDMTRSEEPVFNLVAPVPSDWKTVFGAFAKQLNLPLMAYDKWTSRVSAAAETYTGDRDVQPLALADFFQAGKFGEGTTISTERACKASPALANMSPIGEKDVTLYLDFWKRIGFLNAS
ncbi:unnamed protein product [Peniophora sp. CBMAI 1063]|nr:unnamed protein product [Peniophora sp. CBMAI 1063]